MRHGVLFYEAMGFAHRLPPLPFGVFIYEATRPDSLFRDGVLVDSFGRPFRFEIVEGNTLAVISAGPNGIFGDADDISDRTPNEFAHRPET